MLNPSPPPLPNSLFFHILLALITKVYNPLFVTSVVDPLLSDLLKLISLPIYTPAEINPSPPECNYLNPSWKPSSKSLIISISPTSP